MILDFEPVLTLNTFYSAPKKFFVIGAGGTGGYFVPHLTRQIALQNHIRRVQGLDLHEIIVIDADTVSFSNLNRQNFIESDLDKNKAQVLAERYGKSFKTGDIRFLDEYITSTDQLISIVKDVCKYISIPVLVDCVDNNKTRVFIHEAVQKLAKLYDVFSLSSGNELYTGQVVCGFIPHFKHYEFPEHVFRTPTLTDMFPEVLEGGDKLPTELSCDEQAISYPQSIMTNMTAAVFLFNFANILLLADMEKSQLQGLTYFAQTFDLENGNIRRFSHKKSIMDQYLTK